MTPMPTFTPRLLTPEEVGAVVRLFRAEFGWTQETLAELSGLTPRTVQRLKSGQPSSLDTWRAVAGAFGFEDLDWFSKPLPILTKEQAEAQCQAFGRDHVVLDARLVDGQGLMAMMVDIGCDSLAATGLSELPEGAREAFASLLDFAQDCLDIVDVAPRAELLGYGDQIEELAAPLREAGFCFATATRSTWITKAGWENPLSISRSHRRRSHLRRSRFQGKSSSGGSDVTAAPAAMDTRAMGAQ